MAFTNSGLSEEKKLVWAGLKRAQQDTSEVVGEFNKLRNEVGEYDVFKSDLDAYDLDGDGTDEDISSYTNFKTYLTDNGFSSSEADAFIDKIRANFEDEDSSGTSWDEFEDFAESQESYTELKNGFGTQVSLTTGEETPDGEPTGGIRVLEGGGITYGGVSTSVTTTEIFGRRIELSQASAGRDESGSINYSNIRVTDGDDKASNVATVNTTMTIAADIENTNADTRNITATLTFDGSVRASKTLLVNGGSTRTVSFEVRDGDYTCYEAKIGDAGPLSVCWAPAALI